MEPVEPQRHIAGQLRDQARSCREMGSPLYTRLLEEAATDVEAGGPTWTLLSSHVAPGRGDALALRFMAAVHRLVLTGRAPGLARHYPSAGGHAGIEGAWEAFRDLLEGEREAVVPLISLPCQTNEVGRGAALLWGFLEVAQETARPLRVLEVGASAGLNLRFDRYRFGGGGAAWGDPASPVDLSGLWRDAPPYPGAPLTVVDRRGCDLRPQDPASEETRLGLRASVWADQVERFGRLEGALQVAAAVPVTVDALSLEGWLPQRLAEEPHAGVATVVFHSVVDEYLRGPVRERFHAILSEGGARASVDAPFAWLRLEPTTGYRALAVTLTTWPGAHERLVALCGAHGTDVRRA